MSDDRVRLGAGTLYGILDRLVEAGYTEASGEVVVDGRLRRYYRLTRDGLAALAAETARLTEPRLARATGAAPARRHVPPSDRPDARPGAVRGVLAAGLPEALAGAACRRGRRGADRPRSGRRDPARPADGRRPGAVRVEHAVAAASAGRRLPALPRCSAGARRPRTTGGSATTSRARSTRGGPPWCSPVVVGPLLLALDAPPRLVAGRCARSCSRSGTSAPSWARAEPRGLDRGAVRVAPEIGPMGPYRLLDR